MAQVASPACYTFALSSFVIKLFDVGKLKSIDGDYEGDFVDDKKEGKGVFVYSIGDVYGKY